MHCSRQTMLMFLVVLSFGWSTLANAQKGVSLKRSEIFIETKSGQHRFAVELANTPGAIVVRADVSPRAAPGCGNAI